MTQPQDDTIASLLDLNAAQQVLLTEMHQLLLLLCDERLKLSSLRLAAIRLLADDVIARARNNA